MATVNGSVTSSLRLINEKDPSPRSRLADPAGLSAGLIASYDGRQQQEALMRRFRWLTLPLLLCAPAPARAADIDVVRANVIAFYSAKGANTTDPIVAAALKSLESSAKNAQQSLTTQGSYSDLNYSEVPSGSWSPSTHFSRMLTMAKAYATAGQALYGDATLKQSIEKALTFITTIVYDGCARPGNWWYWRIGVPMQLGPTLLLVQGQVSAAVFDKAQKALSYLLTPTPTGTGENLVWESLDHLYYAAIAGDAARLALVKCKIDSVAVFSTTEEGVMADYSFHQHGAQLYTGGYGAGFAQDLAKYILFAGTTSAQLSPAGLALVEGYLVESVRWTLYGSRFDAAVVGREITRAGKNGSGGLYALLMLANRAGPSQALCTAAAKKMLESWSAGFSTELAHLVTPVKSSSTVAAWPSGHHHYPDSDHTVHRLKGAFASLKMISSRMVAAELVNSEGKKSWHLSDGFLYLVLGGDEYFGGNVWPTLDWSRLPGTTVERKTRAAGDGYGKGTRGFVGGVSDGSFGVAAMDFAANASALTAKKSWFFFEEEIVALGSEIACGSGNSVETTVQQWPLSSATASVVLDGAPLAAGAAALHKGARWAHADQVGVLLLGGADVWAQRETRTGAWSDLGIGSSTQQQSPVFTLWLDHGKGPTAAGYAYALVPGASAAAMPALSATPPVEVLARTATAHAVKQSKLGAVGAVFWKAGATDLVSVSAPCALLYRSNGSSFTLAAADPGHGSTTVTVTVAEPLTPAKLEAGVTSQKQGGATQVTFSLAKGRSLAGRFTRDLVPAADASLSEEGAAEAGPPRDAGGEQRPATGDGGGRRGEGCCSSRGSAGAEPQRELRPKPDGHDRQRRRAPRSHRRSPSEMLPPAFPSAGSR